MSDISHLAVIEEGAIIGENVKIGPFCVVSAGARISSGVEIMSHVTIAGNTSIGQGSRIFPYACLGTQSQDLKYQGGRTYVEIGENTTIREYVTVNSGTEDQEVTKVGSNCLVMAYSHIAHGCSVGDEVIMANAATLAGHVVLEDRVIIGGLSGVHQFVHIGTMSIIGGCSKITQDVMPYMMVDGHPAVTRGINSVGLKRRQIHPEVRKKLRRAFAIVCREKLSTSNAIDKIREELGQCKEIDHMISFIEASERGITR
jgi:UDP-N-acetylglucosamine acyltransferase